MNGEGIQFASKQYGGAGFGPPENKSHTMPPQVLESGARLQGLEEPSDAPSGFDFLSGQFRIPVKLVVEVVNIVHT